MSNFNNIMIIFCLVLGDSIKKYFSIDIDPSCDTSVKGKPYPFKQLNFGHFQQLICDKKKIAFKDIDPDALDLWKVFISTKEDNENEGNKEKLKILQDYAINEPHTEINIEKQLGGVELVASVKIEEIFDKEFNDDKHIHIIIKRPGKVLLLVCSLYSKNYRRCVLYILFLKRWLTCIFSFSFLLFITFS